jgi:hypothetical protein
MSSTDLANFAVLTKSRVPAVLQGYLPASCRLMAVGTARPTFASVRAAWTAFVSVNSTWPALVGIGTARPTFVSVRSAWTTLVSVGSTWPAFVSVRAARPAIVAAGCSRLVRGSSGPTIVRSRRPAIGVGSTRPTIVRVATRATIRAARRSRPLGARAPAWTLPCACMRRARSRPARSGSVGRGRLGCRCILVLIRSNGCYRQNNRQYPPCRQEVLSSDA